jgi:hypothetical protein
VVWDVHAACSIRAMDDFIGKYLVTIFKAQKAGADVKTITIWKLNK